MAAAKGSELGWGPSLRSNTCLLRQEMRRELAAEKDMPLHLQKALFVAKLWGSGNVVWEAEKGAVGPVEALCRFSSC